LHCVLTTSELLSSELLSSDSVVFLLSAIEYSFPFSICRRKMASEANRFIIGPDGATVSSLLPNNDHTNSACEASQSLGR